MTKKTIYIAYDGPAYEYAHDAHIDNHTCGLVEVSRDYVDDHLEDGEEDAAEGCKYSKREVIQIKKVLAEMDKLGIDEYFIEL